MTEQKEIPSNEKPQQRYSCCGSKADEMENASSDQDIAQSGKIRSDIRKQYAEIATDEKNIYSASEQPNQSGEDYTDYSAEELSSIPKESNLGLGSGNPIKLANIQAGETVVDLGSGAGIDCFLAANEVGSAGNVIGIDMTPQMIDKARVNARKKGYSNVEFRLGEIEHMPVADNTVDLIVSNCVINLSVDKSQVFKDAFRVLRPGGRLVISDIILNQEFPDVVKEAFADVPGCVSRAWVKENYLGVIKKAGFERVELLEAEIIEPRNKPEFESGLFKAKLRTYGKEVEVELTPEEYENLRSSIMKGHIRAYKPN
ncbi:MAG: arsenite methyltransferase [Candidatus Hodarchaeales archaeon]|jgi:ubiquinone/menaquinone biosynthesis C-methylase UbiE